MLNKHYKLYLRTLLLGVIVQFVFPAVYASKYYSIIGTGIGYRDFIQDEPAYHTILLSPYFEYGTGNPRKHLWGFNGMIVLNPQNTSEITLFQIGSQSKFFIVPKRFFIGGGPGLNIEGENVSERNDKDTLPNSNLSIVEPKLFFNINIHVGLLFYLFKGHNLIIDSFYSLSVGKPFPYSANLMVGVFSFY